MGLKPTAKAKQVGNRMLRKITELEEQSMRILGSPVPELDPTSHLWGNTVYLLPSNSKGKSMLDPLLWGEGQLAPAGSVGTPSSLRPYLPHSHAAPAVLLEQNRSGLRDFVLVYLTWDIYVPNLLYPSCRFLPPSSHWGLLQNHQLLPSAPLLPASSSAAFSSEHLGPHAKHVSLFYLFHPAGINLGLEWHFWFCYFWIWCLEHALITRAHQMCVVCLCVCQR